MRTLVAQALNAAFLRYVAASAIALGADVGTFLLLLRLDMPAMAASSVSYSLGILVHWLISSRVVFGSSVATAGPERMRQKALFVAAALIGLALTSVIVGSASRFGIDPRIAKLVAVAVSFTTTWNFRRIVVFAEARP